MYSRTSTQFDLIMKTIMVVLFVFGLFIFFIDVTKAADFWVSDPSACPQSYYSLWSGVDVQPERICGVNPDPTPNGTPQPYDIDSYLLTLFSPPGGVTTSITNYANSSTGGYLINCFASTVGRSEPYCSNNGNFWCNRSSACFATPTNKMTICNADAWASSTCGNCLSGYADCDGNGTTCEIRFGYTPSTTVPNTVYDSCTTVTCASGYLDCNGNPVDGCEVQNGGSCSIGGLDGVWQGCACVPPISNFQTGIEAMYSTTSPLLWGKQFGSGDLVSFSNATSSNIFVVKNDASIFMSSTLATTTEQYFYNYNGDLYWGDMKLGTGGGVTYTAGSGLNLAGYEFTIDTSTDFNWTGQHTFNTTTTFPNGVWGTDGKVGIGTTTPTSSLSLVVGDYDGITLFDTTGQMAAGLGAGGVANAGLSLFNRVSGDMSISFNSDFHSWINNNYNFGIGTNTPMTKLSVKTDVPQDGIAVFDGDDNMVIGFGADQTGSGALGIFNSSSAVVPAIILNGDGISYINNNNNFGIGTTTPTFALDIDGDGSFIARGDGDAINMFNDIFSGDSLVDSGEGIRTFNYASKAAFRTGLITDMSVFGMALGYLFPSSTDQWDDDNIGPASFAANVNNKASGPASAAFGAHNTASGMSSFVAGGNDNEASGLTSVILGGTNNYTNAEGSSIIGGWNNTSTGNSSFIGGGSYNTASGSYSFVGAGRYNIASGFNSTVFGRYMTVSGENSFGINLYGDVTTRELSQANTMAIMGGRVGIGTTTPQHTLTLAGDFDIAENGLLRFNGISGSIDQIIKINALGFPEWVDVNSLFVNNTTFNSSTEFNSTSTFNSTAIFEGPSYFNNDVFVSGTISSTNLFVNGNSTTTGDLYVLGQAIFHDILPADNLAYTIGTSSFVWKEGWFGKIFTPEIDFTNNWKLSTTTDGGLAFTSSTQVALAMLPSGQVGIGTTTVEPNLKLKVDGNIGSSLYCDINGNNCFNPNEFGWATPQARYMNTTTANYNGNFGNYAGVNGKIGYEAANEICSSTVGAGYHICQANEILDIIRLFGTSTFAGKTNGWVANGPPGYVTVSTNDCEGYTTSTVSFYGAWWKFNDSSGGGSGKMTNCSTLQPIACCK